MTGLQVLEVGQGPERLVFLHGLFGQGKNFGTVAKLLGEDATSVLVDLPNHGRSPWTDYFDYHLFADLLAGELVERGAGREPVTPIHPELAEPLKDILDETYGLIVYQEQVMAIAQRLAGYTLGAADLLRRVMGKKKKKELDAQYDRFRDGMLERGYSHEAFQTVWDILVPFSDYAFNKSHSAAYGLVSYQTAWLKANYPTEYMAALLQSVKDEKEKSAVYLAECRRMGIKVLPPDVNESEGMYTAVGTDIRFGLGAIRNVGANVVTAIVSAREGGGGKAPLDVVRVSTLKDALKAVIS